jgi:hypothetical protein
MLLLSVISMRHAASRNGMFCAVTWPVSARQTARIEMQNGTSCNSLSGRGLAEKGRCGWLLRKTADDSVRLPTGLSGMVCLLMFINSKSSKLPVFYKPQVNGGLLSK